MYRIVVSTLLLALSAGTGATDDDKAIADELRELDRRTQLLKQEYLDIERDLLVTAKDLEVPNPTQYTIFLSQDAALDFRARQLELRIDGQLVATRNYRPGEASALRAGGAERIYMANLQPGRHRVSATVTGDNGQRSSAELAFTKTRGPKYMELRLLGSGSAPRLSIKEWQ